MKQRQRFRILVQDHFQRAATHVLHHDIGLIFKNTAGVDRDHRIVIDRCRRPRFMEKQFGFIHLNRQFRMENFDRHFTVKCQIQGAVHRRHPANPGDFFQKIIVKPARHDQIGSAGRTRHMGKRFQCGKIQFLTAFVAGDLYRLS